MPRGATISDAFSAVAEPRRRRIIDVLARGGASPVGDLVHRLRLPQPAVSKQLAVLRRAGVVSAARDGRRRLYRLNPSALKPVHDWLKPFEKFWTSQLDRIKQRAER